VDGHRRYRLAQKHGLQVEVDIRDFPDLTAALDWIDRNQIARRNLTDAQFAVVIGRIYERQKKAAVEFADRNPPAAQNEQRRQD